MNVIRLTGGPTLGTGNLTLTGSAGFVGATMIPSSGPGATIEQVIDIEFGSNQANIESGMGALGRALADAAAEAAKPDGSLVYLECQVAAGGGFWRSPVTSGWLELTDAGADLRANGSQGGRLHLARANWWEASAETTLVNAQAVTNHRDTDHTNIVSIAAQSDGADLPSACRLIYDQTGSINASAGLFVGMRAGWPGAIVGGGDGGGGGGGDDGGGGDPGGGLEGIDPGWNPDETAWRYGTNNAGTRGVLLVVNIKGRAGTPVAQTLSIPMPPEATSNTVTVLGESRTITASGGHFTDTFAPLAVHAYAFPVSTLTQSGPEAFRCGWWIERLSSTTNVATYLTEGQTNILLGGAFDGSLSQTTPYLTLLAANNAKGLVGINHGHGVTMSTGTITSVVDSLKSNAGVDGYYVGDEPETEYATNFPPSAFAPWYAAIRAVDADKAARPVVISFNMIPGTGHEAQIARIAEYYPYLDVVSMHNYPFEAGDPEFGDATDRAQYDRWKWMMESATAAGKGFVAVCQGFGSNFSPYRQPTWNELHYQTMAAVVLGVPTVRFWMDYYADSAMKGMVADLCAEMQSMAEEMNNGVSHGLIGGGGDAGTGTQQTFRVMTLGENEEALDLFFEGQDGMVRSGVTGTSQTDSASSNGNYYTLAWSGSAETRLWHVDIAAEQTALAGGKPFRPILRLAEVLPITASEKLWAKWELCYLDAGGSERYIYESPGKYWETGTQLLFGPVLYIPPWIPKAATPALRVILKVAAAGTGAHSIKFDYLDFAPLDGWRQYEPALQSWGVEVEDRGQVGMAGSLTGITTHAMEGPGFKIYPGCAHQFQFYLWLYLATGAAASAAYTGNVSVYYRPRKRNL